MADWLGYVRQMRYSIRMAWSVLTPFGIRMMDADRRHADRTSMDVDTKVQSCIELLRTVLRLHSLRMYLVDWSECSKQSGIFHSAMKSDLWLDLLSNWQNMRAICPRCGTQLHSMAGRIAGPWQLVASVRWPHWHLQWHWHSHRLSLGTLIDDQSHDAALSFCALRRSTSASCCVSCRDLVR